MTTWETILCRDLKIYYLTKLLSRNAVQIKPLSLTSNCVLSSLFFISYVTIVEALVSDHRGNSEKWSQPELVAYRTRMGSRKRPRNKTIEGGRLRELLAERLAYVVGYLSYCSQILFYCLSQKRFVYVQVNEPLALMFCITLNLTKNVRFY